MKLLLLLVVFGLLALLALTAIRSLKRRGVGRAWWATLFVCVVGGLVLGVWLNFLGYEAKPKTWVIGFPVAAAVFVWEKFGNGDEEHLVDYVAPAPLTFLILASNVVMLSLVAVYPVWLANTLWRFLHRNKAERP
jgi:hypothetical protein